MHIFFQIKCPNMYVFLVVFACIYFLKNHHPCYNLFQHKFFLLPWNSKDYPLINGGMINSWKMIKNTTNFCEKLEKEIRI